jgi:hypothetical protein
MDFDVRVTPEACCSRVTLQGQAGLGRLLSLLQLLQLDSPTWTQQAVLIDLRGLQSGLSDDEQVRFASEVAQALRHMKKIAILSAPLRMREAGGVRTFDDEDAALQWLGQP